MKIYALLLILLFISQRSCEIDIDSFIDDKVNYPFDENTPSAGGGAHGAGGGDDNDENIGNIVANDPLFTGLHDPALIVDNIEEVQKYCEENKMAAELVCSKIPNFCFEECKAAKKIKFSKQLEKIEELSFQKYAINDGMSLIMEFSSIKEIESDAFDGMFIDGDSQLTVILNGSVADDAQDAASITIQANAFRGIVMIPGARLNVFFYNYKNIDFNEHSLNGIKPAQEASVKFLLENNDAVYFHTKCASNWQNGDEPLLILEENDFRAIENNQEEFVIDDEEKVSLFQLRLSNIKTIKFDKMSFTELKQAPNSVFQLLIDQFGSAEFDEDTFSSIEQSKSSKFELNLLDGKYLRFSEGLFRDITQELKSQFILSVNGITSGLCIPKYTIQNFKQNKNSSLSINLVSKKYNLYVDSHAFVGLTQDDYSFIQIYGYKFFNVYFKGFAVESLTQTNTSFFELWFSETGNLIFEADAFSKFSQVNGSTVRIGFTQSDGTFQQSPFVFHNLKQEVNSQFIYDFTQTANFELKFPPHMSPRMIATNGGDSNTKILEGLYPRLGKSNRPNRISLLEYEITGTDFCKIVDLPADMIIQLAPKTQCSCSVLYLYRMVRRLKPNDDTWLAHTPQCYQETYQLARHGHEDLDQLEYKCEFDTLITSCKHNRLNQVFKLKDDFKCAAYNPHDHDDYLTIELLNDKNINVLDNTHQNTRIVNDRKSIFDKVNRVTLVTVITMSIIFFILLLLLVFIVIMLRVRNRSRKGDSKGGATAVAINDSDDDDADADVAMKTSTSTSTNSSTVTNAYINPIYKKAKQSSIESKSYLIDNSSNKSNYESEKLQLVVQVDKQTTTPVIVHNSTIV